MWIIGKCYLGPTKERLSCPSVRNRMEANQNFNDTWKKPLHFKANPIFLWIVITQKFRRISLWVWTASEKGAMTKFVAAFLYFSLLIGEGLLQISCVSVCVIRKYLSPKYLGSFAWLFMIWKSQISNQWYKVNVSYFHNSKQRSEVKIRGNIWSFYSV